MFQESEKGYWHVPLASGVSSESKRCWLCITRSSGKDAVATISNGVGTIFHNQDSVDPLCAQIGDENNVTSITGKRKERSPS